MRLKRTPAKVAQTLRALVALSILTAAGCGDEPADSEPSPRELAAIRDSCQSTTFAGTTYSFCVGPATWSIAKQTCRDSGMKLAKSDSPAENDFFKSKLRSSAWLGGSSANGDKWTWDLDGSTFWQGGKTGRPVNGAFTDWFELNVSLKGVCLSIDALTFKWGAEACDKRQGFVCEGETGPTTPVGACPNNPSKTSAGVCGCSRQDTDADGDGAPDCIDECPSDPAKKTAGQNGCGAPDTDSDADGVTDREDECATTAGVYVDGTCGCAHYAAPAGTPCNDGITPGRFVCDGKGVCGDPQASAPTPAAGNNVVCRHRERDGKVYWFCNSAATWEQADALCRAVPGRRLVNIDDGAENAFVAANVTTESWLGANNRAGADAFRWAPIGSGAGELFWNGGANGTPNGRFASWVSGQPNATAGACARALPTSGSWDTRPCAQATPGFVCEGAANPNSVPFNGPGNTALPTDGSATTVADPAGGGSASGHIKGPCELLNLSCPPNLGPSANCVPPEVAFAGFATPDGNSTPEQREAFQAAGLDCADCAEGQDCPACAGPLLPPPPGSAGCADPTAPADKASACEIELSSGVPCTSNAQCAANEVCGFVKTCSKCTPNTDRWTAGENCQQDGEVCSMTQVCGTPVPGCPYGTETSPRCDSEIEICGTAFGTYEGNPDLPFEGNLDVEEILPEKILKHVLPALPLSYPLPEDPCAGRVNCLPVPKGLRMPDHPWCQYTLPDEAKILPEFLDMPKFGKSGNGTFVEFSLDPQLKLDYQAMRPPAPGVEPPPGPFGYLDFGVDARASFAAAAEFRLKGFGGKVKLIELVASGAANKCGINTGETKMALFGKDFLPMIAPDFAFNLPAPAVQAECQDAFAELLEMINRAKKAYRDAQELMRQLKDWRSTGKKFAISLCEQILADPPADFPPIPPEACKGELPEDTINRFIQYYGIQIDALLATVRDLGPRLNTVGTQFYSGTASGGTGGASDAKDVSIGGTGGKSLRAPQFTDDGFAIFQPLVNIDNEGLDQALFNQTFLVGPIPINIEISATLNYGINVSVRADVLPWRVLRDSILSTEAQRPATDLASLQVVGSPWVGAGVAFFIGVGFDVGFAAAKAGVEGALNLGQLSLPVAAGALLTMGTEPDTRPTPPDLAPYVSDLAKVVPKRIGLGLKYIYSANVSVRNVLKGVVTAKVKVKFLFFSKKWQFTLLNFKGICPGDVGVPNGNPKCDIALFSGEGTISRSFGPKIDWAKLSMPLPFLELKRVYQQAMEVLPDGTLPAIPNPPPLPMLPDLPGLPSLPDGGIEIGKNVEDGIGVKLSSLDEAAVFDAARMGAPFFDRLCACIPDEATEEGRKNDRSCGSDADCCEGLTCSPAANGKKVCTKSTVPTTPPTPTSITVRAEAPGQQVSASINGAECPNATCTGVAPGSAVTVSVTVPFAKARATPPLVLVAWRGCAAGPATATLGANDTLIYTSTVSGVSADTTCSAEVVPGALAASAVFAQGETNDVYGTSAVNFTAGTHHCVDVVESRASMHLCFAAPGAVPSWSATPSNGYEFNGWNCMAGPGEILQEGLATSPFDGMALEAGHQRTCIATFAPGLVL